jgi:predicted phosphodiesterase
LPLRHCATIALLCAVLATGTSAAESRAGPQRLDPRKELTLVLVGDTGLPGPRRDAVLRAIRRERKDLIVALGDLVYPKGPRCPSGRATGRALHILEARVGVLLDLGAPVLGVLGNHDLGHVARHPAREACFLDYARRRRELVFPDLSYTLDAGAALLVVLNTSSLTDADGRRIREEMAAHRGWKVFLGHHVLRTYHDKESQDYVRPWLARHGLRPDLYVNGHAHVLQFGVYDGIPAVTSGTGAKVRRRPACPPRCGPGQLFGVSVPGYALLHIRPDRLEVIFKDGAGKVRWSWTHRNERAPAAEAGDAPRREP